MICDRCGDLIDYCQGHGVIASFGAAPVVPCDHCDGEGTEVVVGLDGYEHGPCSRCDATGYVPASWIEVAS